METTMAKKANATGKKSASRKAAGTKVPLHAVVHFVRMLHDRKHAAKFIAQAKRSGASITVPPKGVSFVNDFLKDHNLQNARTARGIDACPTTDPWKCNR
jgi:hypothetical protein